jgi:predicted PurR-regulated permease PerM
MEFLLITLIVLILSCVIGWVIFNLFNKNKKLEEMVIKQSSFINGMIEQMSSLDKIIDKVDATIWVQSDPQLLELFDSIKETQGTIKTYTELKK